MGLNERLQNCYSSAVHDVMQRHQRVDQVVAVVRQGVGDQVEARGAHVADAVGGDLLVQHGEHAVRTVGKGNVPQPRLQREAQQARSTAVFQRPHPGGQGQLRLNPPGDGERARLLDGIGVPGGGTCIEIIR